MDVREYLKKVIAGGIEYYDYRKLDHNAWQSYRNEAQAIAKNEVFNNELNFLISTIIKNIAMSASDFDEVQHARTSILVLEEFKEHLESIEDPNLGKTRDNPYDPI